MNYAVKKIQQLYQGFFNLKKVIVDFDGFDGKTKTGSFEVFDRGDGCAAVIYQKDTDELLLVEQFRYPAIRDNKGWLTEIVAGKIDPNEQPEHALKREVAEEIGYEVQQLEFIGYYYASPGGCTERIFIYYTEVSSKQKTKAGGGIAADAENVRLLKIPVRDLSQIMKDQIIIDAKTMIGLNWFVLNKLERIKR